MFETEKPFANTLNCCMFFLFFQLDFRSPSGFDRTRNVEIGNKNFQLEHLEEAFTSEHWLVRIYRYDTSLGYSSAFYSRTSI